MSQTQQTALRLDALASSHAIEVAIGAPSEVEQIFDDISYAKGASVIRMMHRFLGDDAFRAGLSTYLQRHAYSNASTEDLWTALGEKSGQPVRSVASLSMAQLV